MCEEDEDEADRLFRLAAARARVAAGEGVEEAYLTDEELAEEEARLRRVAARQAGPPPA